MLPLHRKHARAARLILPPARPLLPRVRPLLLAVTALGVAVAGVPMPAHAQSVGGARDDFERAASQYLDAEAHARAIESDLAAIRQEIDALDAQVRVARAIATERAIDVYAGGSGGLETFLSSDSALDAARRTELAGRANTNAQDAIDELEAATQALEDRRADLEDERVAQAKVTAELESRRASLQARLARAQTEYRRRQGREAASRSALAADSAPGSTAARSTARSAAPTSVSGSSTAPTTEETAAPVDAPAPEPVAAPPPPVAGGHPHHDDPFLVCTRARESHGDYTAVNPAGYYGAYQMSPTTWDGTAEHAGRPELIGVLPSRASVYDQDDLAWDLYQWQGKAPWLNRC